MLKHYIISFLISMVPLIELRGALPYALANGIPTLPAYIVCMVANMLPVPVIFFFARKVLEWGKDKKYIGRFFTFCLEKGHKAGGKLQEKAGKRDCSSRCCCLSASRCPAPAPGREPWRPVSWIWISSPASWRSCWVSCWRPSSWAWEA